MDYDDSSWAIGTTGLGYGFDGLIGDGGDLMDAMRAVNASAFARIPFEIENASEVVRAAVRLKYEDGFVAWINGVRVASDNEPGAS